MFTAIYHVEVHGNVESDNMEDHGEQVIFLQTSVGFNLNNLSEDCKVAGRAAVDQTMRQIIGEAMARGQLDIVPAFKYRNTLFDKSGNFDVRVGIVIERERYVKADMLDVLPETEQPLMAPQSFS